MGKIINKAELEYFRTLKQIVIENVKKETKYENVLDKYGIGELSINDTYNEILKLSNYKLRDALGDLSKDRTGTGTYKIAGARQEYNLKKGFPLITTKKLHTRGIFEELFWFIQGDTNIKYLVERNVTIWTPDAFRNYVTKNDLLEKYPINSEEFTEGLKWFEEQIISDDEFSKKWGDLGPVYGAQWRNFGGNDPFKRSVQKMVDSEDEEFQNWLSEGMEKYNLEWNGDKGVDQLANMVGKLKSKPSDRRNLVFAFNPNEVDQQTLPACHSFFQTIVKDNTLNLTVYIRSNDMFLGNPYNVASYALLTHMLAQVSDMEVGNLIVLIGDAHVYANHVEQIQEQMAREPFEMPTIELDEDLKDLEEFNIDSVKVLNYKAHDSIKGKISV